MPEYKKKPRDLVDVHKQAVERYDRGYLKDRENIEAAYDDLRFCAGEGQWDEAAKQLRNAEGRPVLIVDQTSQFVRQVTGDMRQLRPAIKVVPVDDRGDKNVADKIMPGMIRYIEQRSDASAAYFNAIDSQARAGIGHWQVTTEYSGIETRLQEIRIEGIEDGIGIVWDPDSTNPTREDADWCFVPVNISKSKFEERWPDKKSGDFGNVPTSFTGWVTDEQVRIAAYWCKEPAKVRLAFLSEGGVDDVTDDPEGEKAAIANGARVEERDDFKICRYLMSAGEILQEPDDWPGRYIPIIPVLGEEIKIGDRIVRRGVIRVLQEPQRIYNYTISAQTEVMALQPKAPWLGTEKQFENHINQFETANVKNWPFLQYTVDPNAPGPPQRVGPPVSSAGLSELLVVAREDMSTVTGIYPAALGARSNETSGKAIIARQREGDTGTFHYIDNFARAIRHTGRVLIDLIPHVYDTQRTIRIVGEDGKVDLVQINQAGVGPDGITPQTFNDVTIGAYDIAVEMGPSYSTKREEARDGMATLMQSAGPEVAQLFIDLFAKMQDWPLSEQIAKRAKMLLPPQIQMIEAQESGEPLPASPAPPQPTPEQQAEMAKNAHQQQLDRLVEQREAVKMQMDQQKTQYDWQMQQQELALKEFVEKSKAETDRMRAETERIKAELDANFRAQELQCKCDIEDKKIAAQMSISDNQIASQQSIADKQMSCDMAKHADQMASADKQMACDMTKHAETRQDGAAARDMAERHKAMDMEDKNIDRQKPNGGGKNGGERDALAVMLQTALKPRKTTIIRDKAGRATSALSELGD